MDPFVGELRLVAFNFAPQGWASCNGQQMQIEQNTALFALIGTYYGGDGVRTFNLPDLRSRVPVHNGQGVGLSPYTIGQAGGEESHTLQLGEMPQHNHAVQATNALGSIASPSGTVPARAPKDRRFGSGPDGNTVMNTGMISTTGGSQPHNNLQPYLVLQWIIALVGIFPSRN